MNYQELLSTARAELNQWYVAQVRNPFDVYHLYYLPTTAEHDGGIIIAKDAPANPEYIKSVEISGFITIDQHMIRLEHNVLPKLPVLNRKAA